MKRSDFEYVDTRPLYGAWFEAKHETINRGEGRFLEKDIEILCQTFDKGLNIIEKLATPELIEQYAKEYAEFKGLPPTAKVEDTEEQSTKKSTKRGR